MIRFVLASSLVLGIVASCSSEPPTAASADGAPSAVEAQVRRGGKVYAAHCAECHGEAGGGTDDGPQLVGAGALPLEPRGWQDRGRRFRTALDVALFATENMPPRASARAELEASDYWAVLAFALAANGVALEGPVGPENAGGIVLH